MNTNKIILFCSFFISFSIVCMEEQEKNHLLFIDTGFNDPYMFKNFFTLAESVGFIPTFKQFTHVEPNDLEKNTTIIIALDGSFLKHYLEAMIMRKNITHPVLKKIIALLKEIGTLQHKTIGLILPDINNCSELLCTALLHELYNTFNLVDASTEQPIKAACAQFLKELFQSDANRSTFYHTALLHTQGPKAFTVQSIKIIDKNTGECLAKTLPLQETNLCFPLYPLAVYLKNQKTDNQFFITKNSLMTFSEIKEAFYYNPMNLSLRNALLSQLQELLHELYISTQHNTLATPQDIQPFSLPKVFKKPHLTALKNKWSAIRNRYTDQDALAWAEQEKIWCGWAGIEIYDKKLPEAVGHLLQSGLNLIWFEFNPEWYLSPVGFKKNEAPLFLERIERFNQELAGQCKKTNQKPPHIFLGTDITSNYHTKPVHHATRDLYGTMYTKIPSPLDFKHFWKEELLDVFDTFHKHWQEINHGIPVSGIFLDFEMYHAQTQTGQYTQMMDFSDYAWQRFSKKTNRPELLDLHDFEARIGYLLDHNSFSDYFAWLKKEATEIGTKIRIHFKKKFPHALLAAYNIHLPHSWFYQGIMAGLSCPEYPIILATFNNEFYSHYRWLKDQNIYAFHLPVLLLSKFKTKKDFSLIPEFTQYHDGAWFNRVSRWEESRDPKEWAWDFGLESSPLPTEMIVDNMRKEIEAIKINK